MLEIIILSITQGISEFLPISSSAHLILISKYFNFNFGNLTLDISLHLGSFLAVLIFFKNEIFNFIENKTLFFKIIIGSLPTLVVGFMMIKLNIIEQFRTTNVIIFTTIFFGVLLYFSDRSKGNKKIKNELSIKDSIVIGLFQTFSLIPGVSRSGITITSARFLKYNRIEAAKISFLLSIPTLFAVSTYGIFKIIESKNILITIHNFWAVILSFLFSFITLKFFIKFLKKFSLTIFVVYRIALSFLLLNFLN